jgi:hypothetical protein
MAKSNLAKIIPLRPGIGGSAVPSEDVTKKIKEVSESAEKSDEKILKSNEKLSTNLEKLAKAISVGTIKPNEAPNYKDGGTWDQRSVADQAKDTFMGRKGADGKRDPFDKDSLKYKFGTIRGLAKTMNVVEDNSFVGNLLGRREDKLKRADTLMKMNPQMKNLKQFKGDDEKVRQYYIKQHEEQFAPAQAKAQAEKYKLDSMLQSGINPDELAKSVGGKRQIKAVETAQADELLKDKFRKQEVKSTLDGMAASVPGSMPSNVIPFPSPSSGGSGGGFGSDKESTLENNRLMAAQNEMMSGMKENTAAFPIYLEEWREENKEVVKRHAQLIEAIAAGGSGGGGLMDMAGSALDALGGKGKGVAGKAAGMLGKAGTFAKAAGGALMRNAGPLAAAASVISGGVTAYQGYNEASDKVARGEITKEEGTVAKGGAIGEGGGQAVGGAVGALKGAAVGAAVGSVIPVVGTAIGGLVGAAIGGIGGSYLGGKAGKFLGETGGKIKNWFSSSNPDKSGAEAKVGAMTATPQAQTEPKVTHATAASKKIEEAKGRLERNADGSQGSAAQQQGVREYDRVYQEARADGKSVKEAKELAGQARKKAEASAGGSGNAAGTPPSGATGSGGKAPISSTKESATHRIGGEPYIEGQPLSRAQMVAIQYGKGSGNSYPPGVEAQYAKQKKMEEQQGKPAAAGAEQKTAALSSPANLSSGDLDQRAEAARQNALADGASPAEANAIAAKMKKYGSVVSAGQGRGDVINPVTPPVPRTADRVASTSADNQAKKEAPAPNNVTSSTVSSTRVENRNTQAIKPPIRNQDSSFYNMVEARYVY